MSKPDQTENAPARMSPDNLSHGTQISITKGDFWAGPLPSPDVLNQYDPDTVRSIVSMAEKEQSHRHKFLDKEQREGSKARTFGFVITLVSLVGGIYMISAGKTFAIAYVLVIAALSNLVSALVFTWLQKIRGKVKPSQT